MEGTNDIGRTVFSASPGERIVVHSKAVGVAAGRRTTLADREIVFSCRVTGKFSQVAGTLRRKVVELDPPLLGGATEAWLNDAPLAPAGAEEDGRGLLE